MTLRTEGIWTHQQPENEMAETNPEDLWRAIDRAGSIDAYVESQLREHGFFVERRETDEMSKRELDRYKKELKAEAAEKKKLRKEAWQAYRTKHIVYLGENVHWNDHEATDDWDLPNAEERAAENELPKLDTPQQLAEALGLTLPELRWLSFHRDAATMIHYRRFTIPKRSGKERAIWAPLPKLKMAQHWILWRIVERLPVHGAVHGFLPGRSILTNASVHTNAKAVLKMDIENFFPTVTVSRVKGVFRKAGYREKVASLLAQLCTEAPREIVEQNGKTYYISMGPRCLPQGAPTSPALTNTLCLRMDRRLQGLAAKYGWRYTRYADDLTFSLPQNHQGPPQLGALGGVVKRIVSEEGFRIHPEKTRVARSGGSQKVTGLVVNGEGEPRVPRKLKRQIRAAVHNLKHGKALPEGETEERIRGYIAYISMTDAELGAKLLSELP